MGTWSGCCSSRHAAICAGLPGTWRLALTRVPALPCRPCCCPVAVQKERRLRGLHKDIEELLYDSNFSGAVGEESWGKMAAQRAA